MDKQLYRQEENMYFGVNCPFDISNMCIWKGAEDFCLDISTINWCRKGTNGCWKWTRMQETKCFTLKISWQRTPDATLCVSPHVDMKPTPLETMNYWRLPPLRVLQVCRQCRAETIHQLAPDRKLINVGNSFKWLNQAKNAKHLLVSYNFKLNVTGF